MLSEVEKKADRNALPIKIGIRIYLPNSSEIWIERRVGDTTIKLKNGDDFTINERFYVICANLPIKFPKLKSGFFQFTTNDPDYYYKPYFSLVDDVHISSYFSEYALAEAALIKMLPLIKKVMYEEDLYLNANLHWHWEQEEDKP